MLLLLHYFSSSIMSAQPWVQRLIAIVGVAAVAGGGYGVVQSFGNQQKLEQDQKNKQESEAESAIKAVEMIRNQKIASITEGKMILQNGEKLDIVDNAKNDCQVGDTIRDYNKDTENFSCERVGALGNVSYHNSYYPWIGSHYWSGGLYSPNTTFQNGVSHLANNGYQYDAKTKSYTGSNGTKFDIGPANGNSPSIKKSSPSTGDSGGH